MKASIGPFAKDIFKTIVYGRSVKNVSPKFNAGNSTSICPPWSYLFILGTIVLICELIVVRQEMQGFYVEVLKEINTFYYIRKFPFGF